MKKIFSVLVAVIAYCSFSVAQVQTPDLSPRSKVEQKVGLTNFVLDYARPSVRDRKIMGEMVPFGEKWRTGANKNSTISFDATVVFGGKKVEAGEYAIFAKVEEKQWTIYIYNSTQNWGVPREWDEKLVVAAVKAPVNSLNQLQETFSIRFENIQTDKFDLVFSWEKTTVSVPVELMTKDQALASIEKVMAGPSDRDYYLAAAFYHDQKMELELALEYITKAVEMRGVEAYWYTRKKALIEYELGDKKAAIATAKQSLEAAKKANNAHYVKLNEESIKEWSR